MAQLTLDSSGVVRPNPGAQAEFAADWTHNFIGYEGGWGCITADTPIYNPITKESYAAESLRSKANVVLGWNGFRLEPFAATNVFAKYKTDIYRVELDNGVFVDVAKNHLFLTSCGWQPCGALEQRQLLIYAPGLPGSNLDICPSTSGLGEYDYLDRELNCLIDYFDDYYHDDVQPRLAKDFFPTSDSLSIGAHGRNHVYRPLDDQASKVKHSYSCLLCDHPSKNDSYEDGLSLLGEEYPVSTCACGSILREHREHETSLCNLSLPHGACELGLYRSLHIVFSLSPCNYYTVGMRIRSIRKLKKDWVFDIRVPEADSYVAKGMIHHNSGKTFIGARKLETLHVHNAFDAHGQPTGVPSVIIAPSYRGAMDYCVPEMFRACEEVDEPIEWISSRKGRIEGPAFIFPRLGTGDNPSVIMVRSADMPERIAGWQAGAAWGDEPARWKEDRFDPRNDAYIQLTGRVRHPQANFIQCMFTYTNEGDHTRIYEEMHGGYPTHAWYRGSTRENPCMADFYEMQSKLLTPDLAAQYLEGQAANLRGALVYPQFDDDLHIDDSITLKDGLPLCLMLDFNIAPGMHGLIGQYIPNQDMFLIVYELYADRLDVRGLIDMSVRLINTDLGGLAKYGPELHVFGDATGGSHWAGTGESCYAIVRQSLRGANVNHRIRVPAGNPPVVDRVNAVNVALLDMQGNVRVKIHGRCKRLINDLQRMKRNQYGDFEQTDKKLGHAVDAFGYFVSYLRPARVIPQRMVKEVSFTGIGGVPQHV